MKGTNLGELEELVLLTVAALTDAAYSVSICDELEKHTGRKFRLGIVHALLNRLENKGYLNSRLGEPTSERGGRRKRFYELTNTAKAALLKAREIRDGLWEIIPEMVFKGLI